MSDVHDIRHGYNLADIDHLAHIAVRFARAKSCDYRDRYDATGSHTRSAHSAIPSRATGRTTSRYDAGWRSPKDW